MKEDGVHLTEIAPGIDLQKDVLDQMGFTPIIDEVKSCRPSSLKINPWV